MIPKKKKKIKKSSRGRKSHCLVKNLEQIYKIINKVQIEKKLTYIYFKDEGMAATAENIIKDTDLVFEKIKNRTKILFKLIPSIDEDLMLEIDTEIFDDELLEEGFLF